MRKEPRMTEEIAASILESATPCPGCGNKTIFQSYCDACTYIILRKPFGLPLNEQRISMNPKINQDNRESLDYSARMYATTKGRAYLQSQMIYPMPRTRNYEKRYVPPPLGVAEIAHEEEWNGTRWLPVITESMGRNFLGTYDITREDYADANERRRKEQKTLKYKLTRLSWKIGWIIKDLWADLRGKERTV